MTDCVLSGDEIRKLNRDLRILIATNGTLTRILNVVANDEIVVELIKQQIHDATLEIPELEHLPIGRVLQRNILLKGRSSGKPFVAAESLIAIDLLPPVITTSLTKTDRPIGEIMAECCIETFKEEAKVWIGELPRWFALDGHQNPQTRIVARRYRIIAGGQPVIIITEYFLRGLFHDAPREESDRCQHSHDGDTRSGDLLSLMIGSPEIPNADNVGSQPTVAR
jgi:chorismate--pyruvate lyase